MSALPAAVVPVQATGSDPVPVLVVAFKTVTLLLGGVVTYLAGRAAVRTGDPGLRYLAAGFGLVTLGALSAGVADQVFALPANRALVVESALTAVGFLVVAYSLSVRRAGG